MKRVSMVDVLACPRCGSTMSIISVLRPLMKLDIKGSLQVGVDNGWATSISLEGPIVLEGRGVLLMIARQLAEKLEAGHEEEGS